MESIHSFWQLGDDLRGQSKVSEDHKWSVAASKLAEQTSSMGNISGSKYNNINHVKEPINSSNSNFANNKEDNNALDKRYKTLPAAETLPRNERLVKHIVIAQAVTFGGSNIDPTAWEDKKCKGESRFPAQTLDLLDLCEQAGLQNADVDINISPA
ncbi:b2 protein [Phtheirospermum japonicum]|uniref:B2 protein n=1 Tax=Phtheirospermum japonicum TaxID=374723 RepID=A0A830CJ01_9LAMI|nr:b2 protein [Phtheirospermum japonicum]